MWLPLDSCDKLRLRGAFAFVACCALAQLNDLHVTSWISTKERLQVRCPEHLQGTDYQAQVEVGT